MKRKILLTYNLLREGFEALSDDFELIFPDKDIFTRDEILNKISDCDGLISMFNISVDKELIDAGRNLRIIANYGVGYNNVNVEYATQKKIAVTNTPDPVIEPTAELAFSLMSAIARRISECDRKLRIKDGLKWGVLENLGIGLYGKSLGIIGMGRIGQSLARRAVTSGMRVFYHNRNRLELRVEQKYEATFLPFEELLENSDYVSLSLPLSAETFHLMDEENLRKMKKGSILVNTARGAIVDEEALVKVLSDGHLGGAALDVFENEPQISPSLLRMDNVVLSPHNGTATVDGRIEMSRYTAENILRFFRGESPLSQVNKL
jgi:lactate dehydrogenase-like 2-hydroxyacid dehydrogenase